MAVTKAVEMAKTWPDEMFVSVNLSPAQFNRNDLPEKIFDILYEAVFPANRLELEVTENLLMGDEEDVARQLKTLKDAGISIAMDDFGTGYSSLGYLWKYSVDRLKVDRSFLKSYDQHPERQRKIIETIVELGHNLGMEVTVEGVEQEEHVELLSSLNCDVLQGYLFGKPETHDPSKPIEGDVSGPRKSTG